MTVSSSLSRVQYATNGTTGPFSVPFYFLADEDLSVTYQSATADDVAAPFTATGAGDESGGTVTTSTAYPAGGTLTIVRSIEATQERDYVETDPFPAESHEGALDKLTMLVQQGDERIARCLMYPVSDTASNELPAAGARANRVLAFDSSGNPIGIPGVDSGSAAALALDLASTAAGKGASLIGWLRNMVGAVATTVKDLLGWSDVSLFEFLTPAQITDYQTAARTLDLTVPMQAWVTACAGRRAILPKGAAKITTPLVLPNAIEIVGQGWGSSITAYGCAAFVVPAGGAFIQLRQMILFSRDSGGAADPRTQKAIDFQGQYASRCNFVTLDTLYLQGWNIAMNLEYTWYSSINNVYTINTNISLRLLGQCVNTSVSNSYLLANGGYRSIELAIDAGHRGEGFVATACVLASGDNALWSNGFLDVALYGCTADLHTGIAFDLTGVDNFVFDGPWVYSAARCFDFNDAGAAYDTGSSIRVGRATTTGTDDVIYIGVNNKGVQVHDSEIYKVAGVGYPIEIQGAEAIVSGVHITNGGTAPADILVGASGASVSNVTGNNRVQWATSPVGIYASAAYVAAGVLTLPPSQSKVYVLTGSTNVTSMTADRVGLIDPIVIVSSGYTGTWTDGGNLKLNGNMVFTDGDTLALVSDGTNWYEVSRSAN